MTIADVEVGQRFVSLESFRSYIKVRRFYGPYSKDTYYSALEIPSFYTDGLFLQTMANFKPFGPKIEVSIIT